MNHLTTSNHLTNVDTDLEAAVLGTVLAMPAKAGDLLRQITKPSVFNKELHQRVYQAIADLYERNQEIDLYTVKQWLKQRGYDTTGLIDVVDKGAYFEIADKCCILFELAVRRYLGQYGQRLMRSAADPTADALGLLAQTNQEVSLIMGGIQAMKRPTINDFIKESMADLAQKEHTSGTVSGLTTGIRELDEQTNGLKTGSLYILAAGTGVGKTAVAGHIIKHQLLTHRTPVGLFTLEMKGKEIINRFIASETRYSNHELDRGKELDPHRINAAVTRLSDIPLQIWDKPIELTQLKYQAAEWKRQHGIKLLVIDYLQLIKHSAVKNRYDRICEISTTCKELAQWLDIAVLALSQLNRDHDKRDGWKKRPKLSDLRESGQIEQDADGIMMLFRPYKFGLSYDNAVVITPQTLEIHLPKWRNGMPTEESEPLLCFYDAPTNRLGSTAFPDVPF